VWFSDFVDILPSSPSNICRIKELAVLMKKTSHEPVVEGRFFDLVWVF
jgi:hypothetical protein